MKNLLYPLLFTASAMAQSPYENVRPVTGKFGVLPFGSVKPTGWLAAQIKDNLDGFTGHLDSLAPDLIRHDDIYGAARLTKKVSKKDVGALTGDPAAQIQFLWWNSETQSNWRDGWIRSILLTGDEKQLATAGQYVAKILATQDKDGYLGIYDAGMRYKFDNENGELWAQATLLRGLLAWYEFSKDEKVLDAIKRSAANTMRGFPVGSHPFYSINPNVGGLSHGLAYTDIMENLYRITRNEKYLDYAFFLYREFSEATLNEDAQYAKLTNGNLPLKGHGVHTYEHLRSLAVAAYHSGNPRLFEALDDFLTKIGMETSASGGPVGDEWIAGKKADATTRGYEYCSVHELSDSYESLLAKSGNAGFGDKVETLFFNAAQGARHPQRSSIAYLKSDNSYEMTGGLNGDNSDPNQTRYRYSPVHKEAAVCCVPNAGRIAPYYVQHMWMKDENGLVATLLGPCELMTQWREKPLSIIEKTDYPYGNSIFFQIKTGAPLKLKIRRPGWAKNFTCSTVFTEQNGYLVVDLKGDAEISLNFTPDVAVMRDVNGEDYFRYGALVLARPVENLPATIAKTYAIPGFDDRTYRPAALEVLQYDGAPVRIGAGHTFSTFLFNPKTQHDQPVTLVPMGQTILRQVTFTRPE